MKTKRLTRVTAPGLPPYPRLWMDPRTRRAVVSVRHATWQSDDWAIRATILSSIALTIALAWIVWPRLQIEDVVGRVFVFIFVVAFIYQLADYVLQRSLRHFFARQVFATRTTLWFTPEAIALQSRLYDKPLLVRRNWRDLPVRIRFIVQTDTYAQNLASYRGNRASHLQESRMLEMVLTTNDRQRDTNYQGQEAILRTIPITEVHSWLAPRFTMVFTAAAALTAVPRHHQQSNTTLGTDIDA